MLGAMLILFDIDATLITSQRSGVHAMTDAGREIVGDHFTAEGISFAGGLDPSLIADMLVRHDRPGDAPAVEAFRAVYARRLRDRIAARPGICSALPGVHDLLAGVRERAAGGAVIPGLLTGNFPETGAMKLADAGIDLEQFRVRVWGCDSPFDPPLREHLPGVAHKRCREDLKREIGGVETVVIGDTPADVRCALAHNCRALGVATGQYSLDDLRAAGAHHAVNNLRDTDALLRWLLD